MDAEGVQVNENIRTTLRGRLIIIFFWVRLLVIVAQLLPLVIILAMTWQQEAPSHLRGFLIFYGVLLLAASGLAVLERVEAARSPPFSSPPLERSAGRRFLEAVEGYFNVIWLASFLGLLFSLTSQAGEASRKTAPALWAMAVTIVVLNLLQLLFPLLIFCLLLFFLPCIIIFVRRMYPEPERGASQADIDALCLLQWQPGQLDYHPPDKEPLRIEAEDARCTICLQAYQAGETLRLLPCRHHYHQRCADEWFHISATCPLCVRPISRSDPS